MKRKSLDKLDAEFALYLLIHALREYIPLRNNFPLA